MRSATLDLIERLSYKTVHNTRKNHATFIALAVSAWFRLQTLSIGPHIDEMTLTNSDQVFDDNSSVNNDRLQRAILMAYLAGMLWSNRRYDLGLGYDEANPSVVQYRQHVTELITQLNDTTKQDIKDVLSNAEYAEISSVAQSKAIKAIKALVSYETARSALVGSYESLRAFNLGSWQAMRDSAATGVKYDKLWLTAGDDKVEQECLDNAAQGWIGLSVVYNDGIQCPPAHVGCRCALDYRKA